MKKNRASFFNESTNFAQFNPNAMNQNMMNPNMMNQPMPNTPYVNSQSSFTASPYPNQMMPMPMVQEDLESRLAKIERQINRLDHRITKLEQNTTLSTNDFESNINDMYMV